METLDLHLAREENVNAPHRRASDNPLTVNEANELLAQGKITIEEYTLALEQHVVETIVGTDVKSSHAVVEINQEEIITHFRAQQEQIDTKTKKEVSICSSEMISKDDLIEIDFSTAIEEKVLHVRLSCIVTRAYSSISRFGGMFLLEWEGNVLATNGQLLLPIYQKGKRKVSIQGALNSFRLPPEIAHAMQERYISKISHTPHGRGKKSKL